MAPLARGEEDSKPHLVEFCKCLLAEAQQESKDPHEPEPLQTLRYDCKVAGNTFIVLDDPRPEISEKLDCGRQDIRKFITGEYKTEWQLISEAIERGVWQKAANDYRHTCWSDLVLAPNKRKAFELLALGTMADLKLVLCSLPGMLDQTRDCGLEDLEEKIIERFMVMLGSMQARPTPPAKSEVEELSEAVLSASTSALKKQSSPSFRAKIPKIGDDVLVLLRAAVTAATTHDVTCAFSAIAIDASPANREVCTRLAQKHPRINFGDEGMCHILIKAGLAMFMKAMALVPPPAADAHGSINDFPTAMLTEATEWLHTCQDTMSLVCSDIPTVTQDRQVLVDRCEHTDTQFTYIRTAQNLAALGTLAEQQASDAGDQLWEDLHVASNNVEHFVVACDGFPRKPPGFALPRRHQPCVGAHLRHRRRHPRRV